MDEACLTFWISLVDHELDDHEYENPLVSGAAVLGWKRAVNYTPTLSGVITTVRMLVVYHAHHERQAAIQCHRRDGYDEDEAPRPALSHFTLVQEMVHRFMTLTEFGGKPSPMNFFVAIADTWADHSDEHARGWRDQLAAGRGAMWFRAI
jgi:hypothetical protein